MKPIALLFSAFLLFAAACGGGKSAPPAQPSAADEARRQGNAAALELLAVDSTDTMAMQQSILQAKSLQSKYVMRRDDEAVRAFDQAFRQCLREKAPSLYRNVFPDPKP